MEDFKHGDQVRITNVFPYAEERGLTARILRINDRQAWEPFPIIIRYDGTYRLRAVTPTEIERVVQ